MFSSSIAFFALLSANLVMGQGSLIGSITAKVDSGISSGINIANLAVSDVSNTISEATQTDDLNLGVGVHFAPPTVNDTRCGSNQENFNQCVTKVSKDISTCSKTDNVCLCDTYSNLVACYGACPGLPEVKTYSDKSQEFCSQVKPTITPGVTNGTTPTTVVPHMPTSVPIPSTPEVIRTTTTQSALPTSTPVPQHSAQNSGQSKIIISKVFTRLSLGLLIIRFI